MTTPTAGATPAVRAAPSRQTQNDQPKKHAMSDTPDQNDAPSSSPPNDAPETAPAAATSEGTGAVDTGRRIDPALLQRSGPGGGGSGPRQTMRRGGGRPAPPESAIEVPAGAEGAAGVVRVVEPRRDHRDNNRSGPVVDAAAIAERAARAEGGGGSDEGGEEGAHDRDPKPARPPRGGGGPGGDRPRTGGMGGHGGQKPGGARPAGSRGARRDGGGRDGEKRAPAGPDFSGMAPIVVAKDEDIGDFAAMLAESGGVERRDVRIGDRVRATVVHVGNDSVFFELSKTQQAHSPRGEYLDEKSGEMTVQVGDVVNAFVVAFSDGVVLSPKIGKGMIDVAMLEQAKSSGIPVDGTVTGVNKGGFEIALGAARGFCPLGQIDIHFVDDPATLIGKTLQFLVREVKEGGKNVVLSRRALVEKERHEKAAKLRERLAIGLVLDGVVTRIQPFGAFVDIGGLDGLVPVSELSFGRVMDPNEVVRIGEQVKVEITKIEDDPKRPGQQRIGLSMKSMQQDPLVERMNELSPGANLIGKVMRLEGFGAFVELFPGVEGLVHVSEISDRRIRHPEDVLKPGEHVSVRVKDVDLPRRRVSLTMRDADAEAANRVAVETDRQQKDQQRKERLGRGTRIVGVVERIEKYGVFLNCYPEGSDPTSAEKLGSALMPSSETGTPRGADLGKAFPIGSQVLALIIDIDERGRLKASKTAREQAEERALVDEYRKDKGQSGNGLGSFGDLLKAKFGG